MGGFPLDSVRVPVIPLALPSDEMITINDRRWCIFPREAGWGKSYTSHGLPTLWRGSCEWWSNQLYQMAPYTLSDTLDRKISSRFTHPQSPRPGKDRQNPEFFRVGKTRFWKKGPTVCINKRTLTLVEGTKVHSVALWLCAVVIRTRCGVGREMAQSQGEISSLQKPPRSGLV